MLVNGFEISVAKKNVKYLHLYVKPPNGEIVVTCPLDYSDNSVAMFVRTKIVWIKRQREAFLAQSRQTKREYISGETMYLWGKAYYLQVDYDARGYKIAINGDKIHFIVRKNSTTAQRHAVFTQWYRTILKKELEKLVPKWEKITGLKCSECKVLNMRSLWGSCNHATGKITLNLQLVKKDFICVEFVILHELTHILEKNHTKKFTAFMDKFMPNWRVVRDKLNAQPLADFDEIKFKSC